MPTLPRCCGKTGLLPSCACRAGENVPMRWESSHCQLSLNINCSPDSHRASESEGQLG